MATIKVRYLTGRPRDDGTMRYYWQPDQALRAAKWKLKRLSDDLAAATAEAQEINAQVDEWRAGLIDAPVQDKRGSVAALIAAYKKSRHYTKLADKTRADYANYLKLIEEWAGAEQAAHITAKSIQNLYEAHKKKKPRKAAYLIQVLRVLLNFAERESLIPKNTNPATRPMLDYKAKKGTPWSPSDVAAFVAQADRMDHRAVGTAVMLNEWLGQRRGDLLRLSMAAYRDGCLHIRQGKTGAEVVLPVDLVPELKARIEMQAAVNKKRKTPGTALIQQANGKPYTADGFMSVFEDVRAAAAKKTPTVKKLLFKDLRHTAVTRLAEAGAEIPMIAAVTGHSFKACQDIVDRYNIRTTKMAQEAFKRRLTAEGAGNAKV